MEAEMINKALEISPNNNIVYGILVVACFATIIVLWREVKAQSKELSQIVKECTKILAVSNDIHEKTQEAINHFGTDLKALIEEKTEAEILYLKSKTQNPNRNG